MLMMVILSFVVYYLYSLCLYFLSLPLTEYGLL